VIAIIYAIAIPIYGAATLAIGIAGLGHRNTGSAWGNVIAGALILAVVPVIILITVLSLRRRRRRAVRRALGELARCSAAAIPSPIPPCSPALPTPAT
jgi:hypothetical protein